MFKSSAGSASCEVWYIVCETVRERKRWGLDLRASVFDLKEYKKRPHPHAPPLLLFFLSFLVRLLRRRLLRLLRRRLLLSPFFILLLVLRRRKKEERRIVVPSSSSMGLVAPL